MRDYIFFGCYRESGCMDVFQAILTGLERKVVRVTMSRTTEGDRSFSS